MGHKDIKEVYFPSSDEWRTWLEMNHDKEPGIYIILYTVGHEMPSMRWEEAVKVALCFGWIDSTAYSLGDGKRRQYFTRRKTKSVWSAINKAYVEMLIAEGLMHDSGLRSIEIAKKNGSWNSLDDVDKGVIPKDLEAAFTMHPEAFENFQNFPQSYRKSYLYWLKQAKREETRRKRVAEIIDLCIRNIKIRG